MVTTRGDNRKRKHSSLSRGGLQSVDERGEEVGVADVSLPGVQVMSWGCVMPDYAGGKALTRVRYIDHSPRRL